MDIDQIEPYNQNGTKHDYLADQQHQPYPRIPTVQRVMFEPCTHWAGYTYTGIAINNTILVFAGGPLTIGRVTITPSVLCYVTKTSDPTVSASFPIQANGSLSFTVAEPVYLWVPVTGDVSVLVETWLMDDNRLS